MAWNTCFKCKCQMFIPDALNEAALAARNKIAFYCAYGHEQYYVEGESEATKLRRERDRLFQRQAQLEDEAKQARERAEKAERATQRLKKRASAGTCPCCNRTFSNMSEHMKHRHPEFVSEGGAKVVPLKRA